MRHRVSVVRRPHLAASLERARDYYRELRGFAAERQRAAEIDALLWKRWRGRIVYRLTCQADFGKGPHPMWLPEYVLWLLIDLQRYRCAFHR